MKKTCLKCDHTVDATDLPTLAACPACGAIYAKVEELVAAGKEVRRGAPSQVRAAKAVEEKPQPNVSGYVAENLMRNETVVATASVHWWVYAKAGAALLLGGLMLAYGMGAVGSLLVMGGLYWMASAWVTATSTELAITNRRVIAKFGFVRRHTVELLHTKVESLNVEQSVLGRMLNFGTIVVNGTGGAKTPIPGIDNPLAFRRQALEAIDGQDGQRTGAQHPA